MIRKHTRRAAKAAFAIAFGVAIILGGATADEAAAKTEALALRVLAERLGARRGRMRMTVAHAPTASRRIQEAERTLIPAPSTSPYPPPIPPQSPGGALESSSASRGGSIGRRPAT